MTSRTGAFRVRSQRIARRPLSSSACFHPCPASFVAHQIKVPRARARLPLLTGQRLNRDEAYPIVARASPEKRLGAAAIDSARRTSAQSGGRDGPHFGRDGPRSSRRPRTIPRAKVRPVVAR